jgi:hypothetical protein
VQLPLVKKWKREKRMEAIKKKMQAMKVEKDNACDMWVVHYIQPCECGSILLDDHNFALVSI